VSLDTWEGESDQQRIRWHCPAEKVPGPDCKALADLIASRSLLDIDRIPIPRSSLFEALVQDAGSSWTRARFERALEELLSIEVAMVDDDHENDAFFVHE